MRDEIQAGLRNALERGSTLEEAIQSFISAGYNPFEVKEAASILSTGATNIIAQNPAQKQPTAFQSIEKNIQNTSAFTSQQSENVRQPQSTQQPTQTPQRQAQFSSTMPAIQSQIHQQPIQQRSSTKKTLVKLIILLIALLAGLGLLIIFNDDILKILKPSEFWRVYGT